MGMSPKIKHHTQLVKEQLLELRGNKSLSLPCTTRILSQAGAQIIHPTSPGNLALGRQVRWDCCCWNHKCSVWCWARSAHELLKELELQEKPLWWRYQDLKSFSGRKQKKKTKEHITEIACRKYYKLHMMSKKQFGIRRHEKQLCATNCFLILKEKCPSAELMNGESTETCSA